MKFLLVLVVVVGVLWWLLRRPRVARRTEQPPVAATIVACAHCGVHVPTEDAISDGRLHYCSEAHRLAGPRDREPQ